jgi:hypothetical protein
MSEREYPLLSIEAEEIIRRIGEEIAQRILNSPNSAFNQIMMWSDREGSLPTTGGLSSNRNTQEVEVESELFRRSYETLLKQLYGIPVELPEYIIINGLRVNFIPFTQIVGMLQRNEIERYTIDPLLQPWASIPSTSGASPGTLYRIFTFFGKNGVTYLVKAKYNSQTNQILA